MQLFADYIQPVTQWLYNNPSWALTITFLVSFSESLAIIGSIIPGSVTMTAIGILAGSGVMRIDLTLLAAILGAIAGDSASYFLGYWYSDRLSAIWPFTRYPKVITYGKYYFEKHGGKSVLIGRFAGPLRAIIPVIAGMMRMNQSRFIIANVISAIGWSFLYIMPGVLIGAASHELSAETATRLFIFTLALILFFWLAGIIVKVITLKLNRCLEKHLHQLWRFSSRHPYFHRFIQCLTPENETNHYPTVILLIVTILSLLVLTLLCVVIHQTTWFSGINDSLNFFFQSLRSNKFDIFFSIISFAYSPLSILSIASIMAVMAVFLSKFRLLIYWLIAICSALLLSAVLNNIIFSPRLPGIYLSPQGSSFPGISLSIMIAMLFFTSLVLSRNFKTWQSILYRSFSIFIIVTSSLSALYLGDHWFSDVLGSNLIGLLASLLTYQAYRTQPFIKSIPPYWALVVISIWILSISVSTQMMLSKSMISHQLIFKEHHISSQNWWQQQPDQFPHFRSDRFGKPVNLFNIQYAGNLKMLEAYLTASSWKIVNKTLWQTLLDKVGDNKSRLNLPVLTQLYLNKKSQVIMVKEQAGYYFILRAWKSAYTISPDNIPVFFISIQAHSVNKLKRKSLHKPKIQLNTVINEMMSTLPPGMESRSFTLDAKRHINLGPDVSNTIYLIREK